MNAVRNILKKYEKYTLFVGVIALGLAVYFGTSIVRDKPIGGLLASVASSVCYSESDLTALQANKNSIQSSLNEHNAELNTLETKIGGLVEEMNTHTSELNSLRQNLITETQLDSIRLSIKTVQNRMQDLENTKVDTSISGVCSAPGYYDKNSCENASGPVGGSCTAQWFTDEQSCTTAGYYEGGGCSGSGYYDKQSCESAGYSYSILTGKQSRGTCSGGEQYVSESSCTSAGYNTNGGCSDPTYVDKYSCENAGYYGEGGSCSNPYYTNQQTCESENFSWSESGVFVSAGNTWSEPSFVSSGYTWDQPWYEELTEVTASYGYAWKEPQWVNAGYSWVYSSYSPYGYTWKDVSDFDTAEKLEATLKDLAKEYQDKILARNTQMSSILEQELSLDKVNKELKDSLVQKILLKENIVNLEADIQELSSKASKGLCQSYELSCSDSLDNDNDLAIDCSDSDCTLDSYCSKTIGPIVGTSTIPGTTQPTPITPLFSSKFNGVFSTLVSLTNNVLLVNSRDIVPAMKDLKIQSSASTTNPQTLFSKMSTVKTIIESNVDTTTKLKNAITQLRTENTQTTDLPLKTETEKLVTVGLAFVDSLSAYHTTLLKFLTGTVPTPELDVELNQRITDTTTKGGVYRNLITSTNTALATAVKKADSLALSQVATSTGSLRASLVSPRPGEIDVPTSLSKVVVTFAQDVIAFNNARVSIKDSSGTTLRTVEVMQAKKTFAIELTDTLKADEIYTVSVTGTFVEETTLDELSWNQSWSFATEKRGSVIIGTIIDFIDDIFGLGDGKKDSEAICDDKKDNDNNGLTDCEDKACENETKCKVTCGNNKIESPEECDDGNDVDGDGCTKCTLDIDHSFGCTDDNEDGYDDKDTTQRCGCLDKDDDGKDDINGGSCGPQKSVKSCLICEYEFNYQAGPVDVFQKRCNRIEASKKIIQGFEIDGTEVEQCPEGTTHYKIYIAKHSCSANYKKISNAIKLSINHINPDAIKDYNGPIMIEGVDDGCNSAGGLYRKNNPFYNSFESVVKTVKKKDFKNDIYVYQQGHQTYGFFDDEGKRKHTIGVVNLRSTIDSKGLSSGIAVSLGECPVHAKSLCTLSTKPDGDEPYYGQPIACGDPENPTYYVCATISTSPETPSGNYLGLYLLDEQGIAPTLKSE